MEVSQVYNLFLSASSVGTGAVVYFARSGKSDFSAFSVHAASKAFMSVLR